MGNNADFWDARMEYPDKADPVNEIVHLLSLRPMSLQALSVETGIAPGHVGLFILRARTMGYRIVAEGAVNAMYRLMPTEEK